MIPEFIQVNFILWVWME